MPAKNLYHDAVIAALQTDGWSITHDPLHQLVMIGVNIRLLLFEPDLRKMIRWIS